MGQAAVAAPAPVVALAGENHLAPAKINLALHVTGRRADGYHLLSSLVAFAGIGDRLSLAPAEADALRLTGPFAGRLADSLPAGAPNSVAAAVSLVRGVLERNGSGLEPLAVTLEKHLPVASGIGGGSADAGALVRIAALARPDLSAEFADAALALGADVPMCIKAQAAYVSGIGEALRPVPAFPPLPAVLLNPGVPVSTPQVFAALIRRDNPPLPEPMRFASTAAVIEFLGQTRNDLEAAATLLAPTIAEARAALAHAGAAFARMSGSGATVFGLFANTSEAERAARTIAAARPDWWVRPTILGSAADFPQ